MNNARRTVLALSFYLTFLSMAVAQTDTVEKYHHLDINSALFQLEEGLNYGLVHTGGLMAVGLILGRRQSHHLMEYRTDITLGLNGNRGPGVDVRITPINVFWGKTWTGSGDLQFALGAYGSFNYSWQLYPLLQSGHMFWLTNYEIGPRFFMSGSLNGLMFEAGVSSAVLGVASRPEPAVETYFYSLKFSDFIRNAHRDFSFVDQGELVHYQVHFEFKNKRRRLEGIGYRFVYLSFTDEPSFKRLEHGLYVKLNLVGRQQKK